MNDLISRQDAIDAVSDCGICMQRILDLPSVQPEQKHGKWVVTEDMPYFGTIQEYLTCSVCDAKYCGTGVSAKWNYCPNCGAKMDMKGE